MGIETAIIGSAVLGAAASNRASSHKLALPTVQGNCSKTSLTAKWNCKRRFARSVYVR